MFPNWIDKSFPEVEVGEPDKSEIQSTLNRGEYKDPLHWGLTQPAQHLLKFKNHSLRTCTMSRTQTRPLVQMSFLLWRRYVLGIVGSYNTGWRLICGTTLVEPAFNQQLGIDTDRDTHWPTYPLKGSNIFGSSVKGGRTRKLLLHNLQS